VRASSRIAPPTAWESPTSVVNPRHQAAFFDAKLAPKAHHRENPASSQFVNPRKRDVEPFGDVLHVEKSQPSLAVSRRNADSGRGAHRGFILRTSGFTKRVSDTPQLTPPTGGALHLEQLPPYSAELRQILVDQEVSSPQNGIVCLEKLARLSRAVRAHGW
jgi:hypothetical protein